MAYSFDAMVTLGDHGIFRHAVSIITGIIMAEIHPDI